MSQKDVIIMNKENNIAPINEKLNVVTYETENIKNLIYTLAHWILVVLLAVISFVLQYSFLVDTGR